MSDATVSTSELLSGAYAACTTHVIAVVGEEIHRDLLASSREAVLPYVPPLKAITARNGSLAIAEAGDREVFAVPGMIGAFRALLADHRGEISATVASATALNDTQVTALKQALKAALGKDVMLDQRVDPSLLGGLTVKVGSRMIDTSLQTKLTRLKHAMKEVG